MAANVIVDAGFLAALLNRREPHHEWAALQAEVHAPSWRTCEPVISETFYLLGPRMAAGLVTLLRRDAILISFALKDNLDPVLRLMQKYASVPMSLADACLVRMTELLADPVILSTDSDFRIYRRHSRQVVPSVLPS